MTKFTNCSIIAPPEAPRRRRSRVGCSRRSCTRRSHKAPTSSYPPQLPPPTSLTQPNPNPRPNRLNPPPHQIPTKHPQIRARGVPAAKQAAALAVAASSTAGSGEVSGDPELGMLAASRRIPAGARAAAPAGGSGRRGAVAAGIEARGEVEEEWK